jgi:site-specific recombinase XerC
MQKGSFLEFACQGCEADVCFSVFELEKSGSQVVCDKCKQPYELGDETLKRQLQKFSALCRQLMESEEILSNTSVGIDIGEHHVKVPYKILLTRLNPVLDLVIGDQPVTIRFRIEPMRDTKSLIY